MKKKISLNAFAAIGLFFVTTAITVFVSMTVLLNTESYPETIATSQTISFGYFIACVIWIGLNAAFFDIYRNAYKFIRIYQHPSLRLSFEMELLYKEKHTYRNYLLLEKLFSLTKEKEKHKKFEERMIQTKERMEALLHTYNQTKKDEKPIFFVCYIETIGEMMDETSAQIDILEDEEIRKKHQK